jgi:hypothetical protein
METLAMIRQVFKKESLSSFAKLRRSRQNRSTFTEHDFQDEFKKYQECWEWCIRTEGDYFEGGGDQVAAVVPEITDTRI